MQARGLQRMERTPPQPFVCPITRDVMDTPVVGPDGYSYERADIEEHLRRNPTSPMTRQPMTALTLTPNYALRDAIEAWRRQQPLAIDPDLLTLVTPRRVIGRGAFGEVRTTHCVTWSQHRACRWARHVHPRAVVAER